MTLLYSYSLNHTHKIVNDASFTIYCNIHKKGVSRDQTLDLQSLSKCVYHFLKIYDSQQNNKCTLLLFMTEKCLLFRTGDGVFDCTTQTMIYTCTPNALWSHPNSALKS